MTDVKFNQLSIEMVPPETREEIRAQYMALSELLRHFWACFPVTNNELEEKVFYISPNVITAEHFSIFCTL